MPTFREDTKIGGMVPMMKTDDINDQAITKDKIRDGNVTTEKLAEGAVSTDKLPDGAVKTPKIADGNITTSKLAEASVVTSKIADQNVTKEKIADQSVDNSKLSNEAVTYDKLKDKAIITEKLNDRAVTTEKIEEKAITNPKLGDGSVTTEKIADGNVTTQKIADQNVTTGKLQDSGVTTEKIAEKNIVNSKLDDSSVDERTIKDKNVTNRKLADSSVDTPKLHDRSVTNEKMADNTLTLDKFDPELRKSLEAATGLPDNLLTMIQDVDENLAKLNDTVYPIILGFTITPNVGTMQTEIRYSVSSDNKPIVPDTSIISKQINDNAPKNLSDTPSSGGTLSTPIEGAREIFKYAVTKDGRTGKSATQTRYLCYHGGNSAATMTAEILNTLNKISATGVSFNPKVTTNDNDYIWLVVPSYLSITRVTSAGFDVTLAAPQTVTNNLGSFKAYRTANPLTAATWSLVIS